MACEFSFIFPLPQGLHARPAGFIQQTALRFQSEAIWLNLSRGTKADLKSTLSLISTETQFEDRIQITIEGPDENQAKDVLKVFLTEELLKKEETLVESPAGLDRTIPEILNLEAALYFKGVPVSAGVGFGRTVISDRVPELEIKDFEPAVQPEEEEKLFLEATNRFQQELTEKLDSSQDQTEKSVITAHLSIIQDRAFLRRIADNIKTKRLEAASAVAESCRFFSAPLASSKSQYLRERLSDIRDVSRELIARITGRMQKRIKLELNQPSILVAEDLLPSEFLGLEKKFLAGLVLEKTGFTSHTLIMARAQAIPAVTGLAGLTRSLSPGEEVIIDGHRGLIILNPSSTVKNYYLREVEWYSLKNNLFRNVILQPGHTLDGLPIEISANISSAEDIFAAFKNGADGIGLFRTELILSNRTSFPDENEQLQYYAKVAEEAGKRPVTIRTFDIGGDKPISYLDLPAEKNPFLGSRGIRLYEKFHDLIKTQVRAILRAAQTGDLRIMFPMVSLIEEVVRARKLIEEASHELTDEGITHSSNVKVGIMVEVPSVAFQVESISPLVDFFSIGSNDLLQYFFAADRGNSEVSSLADPFNPAFLHFLKIIIDRAHNCGRKVGLCGEIAASRRLLPILVGLGFDTLSLNPSAIPEIKEAAARLDRAECSKLVGRILKCSTVDEVLKELSLYEQQGLSAPAISLELVNLDSNSRTKAEAFQELAWMLELAGRTEDHAEIESALWQREKTLSTAIGSGIAIPHAQTLAVKTVSVAFLKFRTPVEWAAPGSEPVETAIMFVVPSGAAEYHLKSLARLSRELMKDNFRRALQQARSNEDVVELINSALSKDS